MRKAAVIGGGAAGMMTAVLAAGEKTEIHLYEKNEKLGKKLFITGTVSYTHLTLPTIA